MPQMAPLMWAPLFFTFSIIMVSLMKKVTLYNLNKSLNEQNKIKKNFLKNWKW